MKTIYRNIALLFIAAISFSSCAEETLEYSSSQTEKGFPVELTLSYQTAMPKEIVSRATTDVEKKLKELQIFVFSADEDGDDSNNVLKGYKRITDADLVDDTSNSTNKTGSFTIKTTTGSSYIYGIANANTTVYNVEDIAASDWTEENAQSGAYTLTLADFKARNFNRLYKMEGDKIVQAVNPSDDYFVMSGVMNDGKPVTITANADGTTGSLDANEGNIIKLKRILSKVSFNFMTETEDNPKFTLTQYDICNIPVSGRIIESNQSTDSKIIYTNLENNIPSALTPNTIQLYLPENLQESENTVSFQKERENNTYTNGVKFFDNAPQHATYIVAKGKYSDNTGIVADVEYTIHLGDIATSVNNYHNERNCEYTYNITVKGVNEIIVEAKKQDDEDESDYNQGVEGIVLNPERGKVFTLDSHYESCVMRFSQTDIQNLIDTELGGYVFQVETFGNKSEIFVVNDVWDESKLADIDYKWITFAKGGTYNANNTKGGAPITYTSTNPESGKATTDISDLYTVPKLLKYLRDKAYDESVWTNGYMTFTCFVDENYYTDRTWGEFVNINPRKLYIANNVFESTDTKSVYAEVAYAIEQRSIQTFYNRKNADIVAYGCETVDETYTGSNYSSTSTTTGSVGTFDGRKDMISRLARQNGSDNWDDYSTSNRVAIEACMSRNRDLNRDGKVSVDEVRWYIPSYAQYNGLWIGEQALQTESRLYNKSDLPSSNSIMHYYANTSGRYTVWAEEGSSFGGPWQSNIKYIKCIRNLKSKSANVETEKTTLEISNVKAEEANKFYNYDESKRSFDLSSLVDQTALRTYPQYEELGKHHEREDLNKIRTKFIVASNNLTADNVTLNNVLNKVVTCIRNYPSSNQTDTYLTGWRVPNQRELSLMVLENENGYSLKPTNGSFTSNRGIYSVTGFSNTNHKIGFGYGHNAGGSIDFRMYDPNLGETSGWVRCVRDIE